MTDPLFAACAAHQMPVAAAALQSILQSFSWVAKVCISRQESKSGVKMLTKQAQCVDFVQKVTSVNNNVTQMCDSKIAHTCRVKLSDFKHKEDFLFQTEEVKSIGSVFSN